MDRCICVNILEFQLFQLTLIYLVLYEYLDLYYLATDWVRGGGWQINTIRVVQRYRNFFKFTPGHFPYIK
jgi:hypothetical protein